MCDYLNKTNATYYFRRTVPDDLRGYFKTERGNPRSECKVTVALIVNSSPSQTGSANLTLSFRNRSGPAQEASVVE